MVGQTLSHYQLLAKLGEGGMGVVYRAMDIRLNRPVAIKLLPADAVTDAERTRRFAQEARAASALNHPHIITVHEVDSAGGVDFMVMEYVTGTTLERLIDARGLKLRDALKYAAQIADALAAAHRAGIVHRDLKPANVMITERGDAKVLDFGLAKLTEPVAAGAPGATTRILDAARTEEGTILGTVAYMSPEQAEGRPIDARSDIFSFGSLLYEMVTGRRAFQGATKVAKLSAILYTEPTPASGIADGIPPQLDQIIAHCLRKDPTRRFQHLDDVKTLLEQLKDESASQRIDRARRNTTARTRRAVALAVGLLVAGTVGAIWWRVQDRDGGPGSAAPHVRVSSTAAPARPRLSSGGPASANAEANRYFESAMQSKVNLDLPRLRQMLERALELDPHFAEARAWRAFTNWLLLDGGYAYDSALLYNAEDEVRRALQDEPTLARAHAVLAAVYLMQGRKELIPAEVEQALKVNPTDEDALHMLLHYHHYRGDYAAAQRVAQQNLERLPLFYPSRMILGEMLRQQGDLAGAIREQERILEQDPQNSYAIRFLARAHLDAGDLPKARRTLDRALPAERQSYGTRMISATLLALEGKRGDALKGMDEEVLKWAALVAHYTSDVAAFYAAAGDSLKALDWLDRAVRNGDDRAEYFRRDPLLSNVRDHPRFQQILQSIAYRRAQRTSAR